MDMAFINAINASAHFPPHDPWMSGETLNYYYLGHLVFAWPMKLLGLAPGRRLPALLGRADGAHRDRRLRVRGDAVGGGARGARRARAARRAGVRGPRRRGAGDDPRQPRRRAHVAATPPTRRGDYAWFDPSRVIPDTINEFPSFSFVLGDLHAHVLALPFTVLAMAFALQVALRGPRGDLLWRGGRRGAGGRAGGRRAVRDQLVVVSGRRRAAGRGGRHLDARPTAGPRRLPGRVARARAGGELRADPAVRLELRPRGARDRGRRTRAGRSASGSATWR